MKKLFKIVLGCTPKGRLTEQHDVFFGIGENVSDLKQNIVDFWPVEDLHIDSWECIEQVENYKIEIIERSNTILEEKLNLFFFNLGGYIKGVFEEQHYQKLIVAKNKTEAIKKIKEMEFYKTYAIPGGKSHIDNQYGFAIDEIFKIKDILGEDFKSKYLIRITEVETTLKNQSKIGYIKLSSI